VKIAVAGKGGTGKTMVAGTLARLLARQGLEVVAVDADGNPNLGVTLGFGSATAGLRSIRNELDDHHHGQPSRDHDLGQLIDELAVTAPDGVRLVQVGTIERPSAGCLCCGSHSTLRDVFDRIPAGPGRAVIADLEAGANDLLWARPDAEDILLVLTDSSRKSLEVAGRLLHIGRELKVGRIVLVANRLQEGDLERIQHALPDTPIAAIPEDPHVSEADRLGKAVLDVEPDSPAVAAIRRLSTQLPQLAASHTGA
jgi:CO dehydrogenase maturation factor